MAEMEGFFQLAYVVADLDVAMQRWIDATQVGPFFVRDPVRIDPLLYRGQSTSLDLRVALCQMGDMQLELIQQTSAGPSAYRDSVPEGSDGVHHISRLTRDFDGDLKRQRELGIEVATEGSSGGVRFAYLDTRPTLSIMTELVDYHTSQGLFERFRLIAEAADGWDGTDPIRRD